MNTLHRATTALLIALCAVLSGCVQLAPIPAVAHAGDTVVLGLGGIHRNWGGEKPRNLQLSITDSASQTFPLQPLVTFQAYPDYRAGVNVLALGGNDGMQLQPFDGAWFISVPLTDSNDPLNLAPGAATIHVAADNLLVALDEFGQPYADEGDLTQLPLEIIAGPPSPSSSATQFAAYDSRSTHFVVRPADTIGTVVGGAQYALHYQSDSAFDALRPMPFPMSRNPFVKMDYKVQENGDGSGTYFIHVYNPAGFTAAAPRAPKQASLQDLGIYLEYFNTDSSVGAAMQASFSLDAGNSYFIDIDGDRIEELQPEMLHASQL